MPRCNHDASCNTIWRFFFNFNSTCQTAYHCLKRGQVLGKVKWVAMRTLFIFPITGYVMDGSTFLETTFWSPMVLWAQSKMVFLMKSDIWRNKSDFRLKSRCQLFVHHKRKISIYSTTGRSLHVSWQGHNCINIFLWQNSLLDDTYVGGKGKSLYSP